MLPDGSIRVDHVWKRFAAERTRALFRDHLTELRQRLRGRSHRQWRWALRDIAFSAEPGEAIGLFGTNGSGKSTLLKILTQVMYPYAGSVDVRGRVGALIEVGTGLHPDLTGRENTYFYGSILGLSRVEVARRFDEIVEFAELSAAIDRQLKFFSNGMKMRLGFAVAAFLEPDVLLVDEVLAVGDAAFQQKCLDRMRQVLMAGTTLVLVSHDLQAVEATCRRGIWLRDGLLQADGGIRDSLAAYRRDIEAAAEAARYDGPVRMLKAMMAGPGGDAPRTQQDCTFELVFECDSEQPGVVHAGVSEGTAAPIFSVRHETTLPEGESELRCRITRLPLPRGRFYLWVGVFDGSGNDVLPWHPATSFEVQGPDLDPAPVAVVRMSPVHVDAAWTAD